MCLDWHLLRHMRGASASGLAALETYEAANVSGLVASQTLPFLHGIMVIPSARFPSDQWRPDGSRRDSTLAEVRVR